AINVYLRDTEHLLEVVLLAWFWMSAIAYNYGQVATRLTDRWGRHGEVVAALNPVLTVVITFQRTLYNPNYKDPDGAEFSVLPAHPYGWYVTHLAVSGAVALALLYGALALFSRLEDNFAEEI
ncbi:MAG: ABC transporter permease, partial [Acidimicrobiales bacterium]